MKYSELSTTRRRAVREIYKCNLREEVVEQWFDQLAVNTQQCVSKGAEYGEWHLIDCKVNVDDVLCTVADPIGKQYTFTVIYCEPDAHSQWKHWYRYELPENIASYIQEAADNNELIPMEPSTITEAVTTTVSAATRKSESHRE